ncbi:MAG TPA: zinc dependent phospholipase C family protein [Anaerolineales bacterium]|nr:zinc dependent phospholipase C family protein [Anaerolineales bacterium]
MPTPFNHLVIARDLLPRLPQTIARVFDAQAPAWLLGNIAPDVQTVSRQTRYATHFFHVPLGDAPRAHRVLFAQHPELADPHGLPLDRAVFLAGYLAHLEFDQHWISDIFEPVFGQAAVWETPADRIYLHNALRAWWDAQDLADLGPGVGVELAAAAPRGWLAFVTDGHLSQWRDFVADQLRQRRVRTAEVFAERMQVDVADFAALVESPGQMAARVFPRCSPDRLQTYRERALAAASEILVRYWSGSLK